MKARCTILVLPNAGVAMVAAPSCEPGKSAPLHNHKRRNEERP
jgi:hypothetical protein